MVTLPTTTTTTHVYFLGSFIFPSILLLRERPKCGDIFLESDEHMFLKYQNFSMCLNVEKNEMKRKRGEQKKIRPATVIIDTNRILFQRREMNKSLEDALQCLTRVYEPQLQFKMSKKLMKFVQWLLSFSTNIFCSGCVCVCECIWVCVCMLGCESLPWRFWTKNRID